MAIRSRETSIREVKLARAHKLCVKRIMDTVDTRTGGGDKVIREAVMVELAVFHQKANELIKDVAAHVLEEFFDRVDQLVCQYGPTFRI